MAKEKEMDVLDRLKEHAEGSDFAEAPTKLWPRNSGSLRLLREI